MKYCERENGRVILLVLVTVFALSAFWFIALSTTGFELQAVGGRKSAAQQLFDAEAGLNVAMENFGDLTDLFTGNTATDVVYNTIKDPTSSADPALQRIVAEVTVRPIQEDTAIALANGQPAQAHKSTPPAGSSSGVNSTVTRRYSINSVAGDKELQVGVYRIVPK